MAPGSPSPPPGPPANKRGAREAGKVRWRRRRRRGSRRAASGDGLKASGRGGGGFGGGLPVTPRVYFIWRRRATRRGWGRGDGEERAPRPLSEERERASCGDEARRERREGGEVLLASASPIILHRVGACDRAANHECSSVPVYAPLANRIPTDGWTDLLHSPDLFSREFVRWVTWGLYEIAQ
jgi:hypothetical protein